MSLFYAKPCLHGRNDDRRPFHVTRDQDLDNQTTHVRQAHNQSYCNAPGGVAVSQHVRRFIILSVLLALFYIPAAVSASAETLSPQWTVTASSRPTNLSPGGTGLYTVRVQNTGDAPGNGEPMSVTDILPEHVKAVAGEPASGVAYEAQREMSCAGLTCTYAGIVGVDNALEVTIPIEVEADAREGSTVTNLVKVLGGGALEASRETPSLISSTPAPFGIAPGSMATVLSSTQAGAHPDVTATLEYTSASTTLFSGNVRENGVTLPSGFAGDLADTPKCPISQFSEEGEGLLVCSLSTVVGTVVTHFNEGPITGTELRPLVNLSTNPGEIARFGFTILRYGIEGTVSLTPGGYAVRTNFTHIPDSSLTFDGFSLTVWGVPAEASHNLMRGLWCVTLDEPIPRCWYVNETRGGVDPLRLEEAPNGQAVTTPLVPYITSPTDCTSEPLQARPEVDSWEEPEHELTAPSPMSPMTGCSLLEFTPALTVSSDTTRADTPAGFTFGVNMNQEGLIDPEVGSQADIKDTTVTLPEGVAINPGQANGLGACQESQEELDKEAPTTCPPDSKVGTVEVETPILRNKLDGNVYVLQSNPPNLKLLIAPEDPADGIYVKFVGDVHLNETTGQLVTTFEHTPQLPFSAYKISFSGGAQAALTTPTTCGTYKVTSDFTPWATPSVSDASPSASFAIESGTNGAACPPQPLPFSPSMIAGPTTDQAGGFTDFSLLLTRADDQQRISRLQFKTPEGLLGEIAKVPLCTSAQADADACSQASQIGHTVVEAGPGPYPLVVPQPGQPPAPIYLTESYDGAPFGLLIKVPLVVGPFTLSTQVVRARVEVDPHTSQLTVTTNPLPQIIDGVPADLRDINAVIDRPEFMFNPTNCKPTSFSGTATSTEGTAAAISSRTQVGSCRSLLFKPDFKVSTSGKTSKANGASLDAKVVYPRGPLGDNQASSQSNIAYVKVDLPKQLPSRLTTLQKACTAAQFEANPGGCPAASVVGIAKAVTPVLPVALTGPVYFVSHGGEAFPSLIVVLQGYGVTVDLVGTTFISKAGITSSTFKTVPDVPIYSFELYLPEGRYSALAANGNLCTSQSKLKMPTEFVAQNGAVIHQSTKIAVTSCPKTKKAKKAGKASRARKARGARDAGHPNNDRRGSR